MSIRKIISNEGVTKWEVRYHLRGRGSKRVRLRFDTKADADAHWHERLLEKRQQKLTDGGVQTFDETTFQVEAERWLGIQGAGFSPSHMKRVKGILSRLIPHYGNLSPSRFHPGLLSQIQTELLSSGLKPASVNRYLEVVLAILNFSAKQRRIPYNPCFGFEKLKEVRDGVDFWEQDEAESFLAFSDQKYPFGSEGRWKHVVYVLALNTALRAGEIWGLQPSDSKQNGEVLHIQRQFDRVQNGLRPTKGKTDRRVPCNPALRRELDALVESGNLPSRGTTFHSSTGRPVCHDDFKKRVFGRDVAEWGGKRLRFHDLRHTGITLMIANGLDLKTVQEIAGHQDIKTTMRYAHLLADRVREVARTFSVQPRNENAGSPTRILRLVKSN